MNKKHKTTEDQLYIIGICLLIAVPFALLLYRYLCARLPFFGLPCLLRTFTGYYCPGCGGTRAVYALLHMRLIKAFLYHPLVPYSAAVYLWFMISHTIEKLSRHHIRIGMRAHAGWLWGALVILAVNVLVKDGALFLFGIDLLTDIP